MRTFSLLLVTAILAVSLCSVDAECPDCSKYVSGALIRDPDDCAHYYKCVKGRAVRQYCGRGFIFDDRHKICNFPSLVDCHTDEEDSSEEDSVTEAPCKKGKTKTTTTTACPKTHTHSRRRKRTTTTTCKRTTTPRTTTCKPARTTRCTTPRSCGKDSEESGECTDNKLPDTLQKLSDCKGRKDGTIFLDGKHCRRYYVCRKGKAKHERCSRGLWFDGLTKTCKNRGDCSSCPANCD